MGKVLVGFVSAVCCDLLLLYQVLRPGVVQGGPVADPPPSPDRSLARHRSIVAAVVGRPLAALVARPSSFDRPLPFLYIFMLHVYGLPFVVVLARLCSCLLL